MNPSIFRLFRGMTFCAAAAFFLFLLAQPAPAQFVPACASFCTDTIQIIGCDQRTLGPVSTAEALATNGPWRHVGQLSGGGSSSCTGTLIGPKHVLTAAHCVIDQNSQFKNGPVIFRLARYKFNECGRPYGTYSAVRVFVPSAYDGDDLSPENKVWDYAVVELTSEIPDAVPMAFGYLSWATIQDLTAYSIGYPGDKDPANSVWQTGSNNDFIDSPYKYLASGDRGLLYATNDGALGQSGSPMYVFHNGQRVIVGVYIGTKPEECAAGRTWAARLTPGAVERIENALIYPGGFDASLRVRNIPPAQIPANEPPANCN